MYTKKIAILGTNGIPAKYGGFETLAENLVDRLHTEFEFIVYCSKIHKKETRVKRFKNAKLIYLPFKANGVQSLIYDLISFLHALIFAKTILFLGPTSSGFVTFFNFLFKRKVIVNHGGLNEWERDKYTKNERRWARLNHRFAARNATINITDNSLLRKSLLKTFGADSVIVRYGGDHYSVKTPEKLLSTHFEFLKAKYYLCVCRAQIDNNIHLLIDSFKDIETHPLVIISNWQISDYGKDLFRKYCEHPNLILLDAIYDVDVLNEIRKGCHLYIHSHSFCGTAPSLVEVMNLNTPILCYDVATNRETTKDQAIYFDSIESLQNIINTVTPNQLSRCKKAMYEIAKKEYTWEKVSKKYAEIFRR